MTTILVATDFSANAHWATDYALELANQLHTRLVIIHAYDPNPNTFSDGIAATTEGQQFLAMRHLSKLRSQMMRVTKGSVEVEVVARPGSAVASLVEEAANQKADLLVMGVVGDEPLKARRLGSLATGMIPQTSIPMLLIPPGAVFQKPQTIVLAVDLSQPLNTLSIDTARQFARILQASVDIICIEDEPDEAQQIAARHMQDLFRDQPHTFRFVPGYDIATALDTYLSQHKADLLILLPGPHSRLRLFLLESDTQEVARLATIPVLAAV
ncbi:universal stress protein [Spirosoma areae]